MENNREYCRLCAGYQPQIKLIELQNNIRKCRDILKKLSRLNLFVNLSDDVLPKVVCLACVTSLERAYNFVAAVEQGQLALNNLIYVRHIKQEKLQEEFPYGENGSYENSDYPPEAYVNAELKLETENVNTYNTPIENYQNLSDGDSCVYVENIKGEAINVDLLNNDQRFANDDSLIHTENNIVLEIDSDDAPLKSSSASGMHGNKSVPGSLKRKYRLVNDERKRTTKKRLKSSSKFASNSKNCKKNIKTKRHVYRWNTLPASEVELSWKDYNWTCSYCEAQFPNFEELRTHSMENHKACNAFHCTDCKSRKLHLNSFLIHVKKHQQYLKFSCYLCPTKFTTPLEAAQHREVHITSDFVCSGCNTNYATQEEWYRHTKMYFKSTRASSILAYQDSSLICKICHKIYKTKGQLTRHVVTHSNNVCEVCGKVFALKSSLARHLVTHSDARPYQCEICSSRFKTPRRLKLHIATHDEDKPFGCDTCGRYFRLKSQLVNHLIIHTDYLPHVCTYCHKGFRNKGLLNQHMRQHTGVKPYSCNSCKWKFSNWANYNKHMKRKHDMNTAKTKRTPVGSFPIDPNTGEVLYPSEKKMTQIKQTIMELKNGGRKRTTTKKSKCT